MLTFSRFSIDPSGRELLRDGSRIEAQPLVLALLAHLAANDGRLVTKDELIAAVWKGQDVSDEVIARAVMKARRAIDDDARAPVHIFTEPGRGYRFSRSAGPPSASVPQAPTHAPAPAPAPAPAQPAPVAPRVPTTLGTGLALGVVWRVLPFVNRSENPALNWTVTGLQRLLHHAMEAASQVSAVTSDPGDDAERAQSGLPASRIVRAAAVRPVDCVVTGDIEEAPAGFQLSLAWKTPGHAVASLVVEGSDLPALVLRAAAQLAPPAPWQVEVARSHPQAWARLNETVAHLRRWPRSEVVTRLQRCYAALPPLPQLSLQLAELLIQLGDFEQSEAAALDAHRRLEEGPSSEEHLEFWLTAKVVLGEAAKRRGNLPLAKGRVAEALEFVKRHEGQLRPGRQLALLWAQSAFLHREAGNFAEAAGNLERAILISIRSGLQDAELRYRASLSQILSWQGEPHRAENSLRQVISRASEADDRSAMCTAMAILGSVIYGQGRNAECVHWSRKALAVALATTDDRRYTSDSRVILIEGLISNGDLDAAERSLKWRRRSTPVSSSTVHELGLLSKTAWLRWRQGRLQDAAECYHQVLQDSRLGLWVKWANYLRSEYAILLSLLGRADDASATLEQLPSISLPAVVGRARAAIAMAQGRRTDARTSLTELLPLTKPGEPEAHLPIIDLAWLLIEDGEDAEAEFLLDRSMAMESDVIGVRWIQLALQDRVSGDVDLARWEALRAASPSLMRHCPGLGTPEDVRARNAGRAPNLPNLLTVLSW